MELTSFRMSAAGKQRICSVVVRDVELPPAEAVPGIEVKHDASGGLIVRFGLPQRVHVSYKEK